MANLRSGHYTFLNACFLAIIFGLPLADTVIQASVQRRPPPIMELFSQLPSEDHLRAVETDVENVSWFPQKLRPWWQVLRFRLLDDLGEKVLLGRDGWLFYSLDVRYLVDPEVTGHARDADPFSAILKFRDELSSRGIQLLVVPMPGKPSIYPDKLRQRAESGGRLFSSRTIRFIARLREAGVEVSNLFETFKELREKNPSESEPYYLVRDTHWSGKAAGAAAEAVAAHIRRLGWADSGSTEYEVKPVVVKRRSDIAQMVKVPGIEEKFPPEDVLCYQVLHNGKPYQDDPRSPVLVLGDSFLRIYQTDAPASAGFIAHLAVQLKRPIASIVNDGGASTLVRQELARRPGVLKDKRLVIWEFVERDIRFGIEGWKHVALP
jgi:SGNH hydrolase-like domain, acetyltransferase AlgX